MTRLTTIVLAALAAVFIGTSTAHADHHTPPPVAQHVASDAENNAAIGNLGTQLGTAVTVGGFAGTVAGGLIGCLIGGVIIPAVGCIPGIALGVTAGTLIGTIAVGGPTLILAGIDTLNTMNAAPGTTRWAK